MLLGKWFRYLRICLALNESILGYRFLKVHLIMIYHLQGQPFKGQKRKIKR